MKAIGLDVGTTGISGVLVNLETGNPDKEMAASTGGFLTDAAEPWARVQSLSKIRKTAEEILEALTDAAPGEVVSIGITGQMHGILYVDREGNPVSDLITWQDERGNLPFREGKTYCEWMREKTGLPLATGYGAVTLFFDQENGRIPGNACGITTVHDYLARYFVGETGNLTHPQDGASLGFFDLKTGKFDDNKMCSCGLDPSFFPQIGRDFQVLGTYRGIPVSLAIGDNQAGVIGAVSDYGKSLLVNVGTGSQISAVVSGVRNAETLEYRPFLQGKYLAAGSALCGGRALAVLRDFLADVAERMGTKAPDVYGVMNALMGSRDQRSPLSVDTRLSGTRRDPSATGSVSGITDRNLTLENLWGGFLDGIVGELFAMYEEMRPVLDGSRSILVGAGNGIRKNPSLRARFSRDFGMPVLVPRHKEEAAFGAALYGTMGAGRFSSLEEASRVIRYGKEEGEESL